MPALQGGETLLPMGAKCSQALHLSLLVKGEGSSICNILCRPLLDAPVPMLQLVTLAPHEGQSTLKVSLLACAKCAASCRGLGLGTGDVGVQALCAASQSCAKMSRKTSVETVRAVEPTQQLSGHTDKFLGAQE